MEELDRAIFSNYGFILTEIAVELSHRQSTDLSADKANLLAKRFKLYCQHLDFIRYPNELPLSPEESQEIKPLVDFFSEKIEQIKLCGTSDDFKIMTDELRGYAQYLEGIANLDEFAIQELTKLCRSMSEWCLGRLTAKPKPPQF